MKQFNPEQAACNPFSLKLHLCYALLIFAAIIIPAQTIHGASFTDTEKYCEFSKQLQSSPSRGEYKARLANELGTTVAANTHTDDSVQSDAPSPFTRIYGSKWSGSNAFGIDSFSMECVSCHDGGEAPNIDINYRNSPTTASEHKYAGGKDHPIGMDYQSYVGFSGGDLKYVSMSNVKMIFVDGKVGCLTCHDPLNPEKKHLVVTDVRDALCRTCHNK